MNHATPKLKHLDVFAGIAGFSLAFESAGFKTAAFIEFDEVKQVVLRDWYPDTPILSDTSPNTD